MDEQAHIRPMCELEFDQRTKFSVCQCDRATPVEYIARWVSTRYNSRRYALSGGRSSSQHLETREMCPACAIRFARDNGLKLRPAPMADPAPGQTWVHWRTGERVVVVEVRPDALMGRDEAIFSPSVRDMSALLMHAFLRDFDP